MGTGRRAALLLTVALVAALALLVLGPRACEAAEEDYYDFRGTLPGGVGAPAVTPGGGEEAPLGASTTDTCI